MKLVSKDLGWLVAEESPCPSHERNDKEKPPVRFYFQCKLHIEIHFSPCGQKTRGDRGRPRTLENVVGSLLSGNLERFRSVANDNGRPP